MLRKIKNGVIPRKECKAMFESKAIDNGQSVIYCNYTHDGILCWPPTKAGSEVKQPCPSLPTFNPFHFAYRRCGPNGKWLDFNESKTVLGKTHFAECLTQNATEPRSVMEDLHQNIIEAGKITNILGIILLIASLVSIIVAMMVYYFVLPKFVNTILHVKIQKHLFISVTIDAITKLSNQIMLLIQLQANTLMNVPFACEFLATGGQYAELAIVMWLALDTHFIQVTSRSGHLCTSGYMTYVLIGWGVPVIPTSIWAVTLVVSHKVQCWNGHTTLPIIWIMEVSKLLAFLGAVSLLCVAAWRIFGNSKDRKMVDTRKIKFEIFMTSLFLILLLISILAVIIPTHAPIGLCVPCQYVATVFTSSRGIMVSILYCFLSYDVHEFIKYSQTILPIKT